MDIAALSMAMSQQDIMTQIGTAVLDKTLESVSASTDNFTKILEQSVTPNLGQSVDILV